MPSLEVVIGLILIILFYSLLATIVMELISNFLHLRGRHLLKILKNIMAAESEQELKEFLANPMYEQLAGKYFGKTTPPSYISSGNFRSILLHLISVKKEATNFREKIGAVSDPKLKAVLMQLYEEANERFDTFQDKVEEWYDEVMERAGGWYKRRIKRILLLVGLAVAIIFNADTLAIYSNLVSNSSVDLEKLVAVAEAVSANESLSSPALPDTAATVVSDTQSGLNQQVYQLIEENLEQSKDALGIGWTSVNFWGLPGGDKLWKIFGWIITGLAISMGAPFWFGSGSP